MGSLSPSPYALSIPSASPSPSPRSASAALALVLSIPGKRMDKSAPALVLSNSGKRMDHGPGGEEEVGDRARQRHGAPPGGPARDLPAVRQILSDFDTQMTRMEAVVNEVSEVRETALLVAAEKGICT